MSASEPLPLDARLLSNAVMELNIARHILGLYPREHQLVQASLDRAFAVLGELFELRAEVTLAVAKDALIVDGRTLDPKNPVHREFALALSRLSIAFVSFVKGVTREEVWEFFHFLGGEPAGITPETLPKLLEERRLRHILVQAIDYRAFAFAVDRTHKGGADPFLLERQIKALAEGGVPADEVRLLTDQLEPEVLAGLLSRTGASLAREESYDAVVSSYLRGGTASGFSGPDLERLMDFVEGLRPELKRQFLSSSLRTIAARPAVLGAALEEVSVDRIIDFFGAAEGSGVAVPETLGTLVAQFARSGVELPGGGLGLDDVLLSREVASLFKVEEGGEKTPEAYRREIRRLQEAPAATAPPAAALALEPELEEDYVAYCYADALLALLETPLPQLIALEDEEGYVRSFAANAMRAVESGQYGQMLEMLQRLDDLERRGRHEPVVRAARDACTDPVFVEAVVASLCRHGRSNRPGAAMVCAWFGAAIVPALFDRLAVEERAHVRRLLLQLLAGLGAEGQEEATRRLRDKRWHVRRNALYLLAETGARCETQHLLGAMSDPEPRVRLECARCLVRAGVPAGAGLLRSLLLDPAPEIADAAVAVAVATGARVVVPDLVALAKKSSGSSSGRRRLRAVHALGLLGGEEAARALEGLRARRRGFFAPRKDRFRAEVERSLQRIARRQAAAAAAAGGSGVAPTAGAGP